MKAPTKTVLTRSLFLVLCCFFSTLRLFFKTGDPWDEVSTTSLDAPVKSNQVKPQRKANSEKIDHRSKPSSDIIEDISSGDSFSACILWMDDNHRLEEWLAYHYYLLKMRYVVLNLDPWSRTSPKAIIDRWNDRENKYNLNMTIVTMTDSDYVEDYDQRMETIKKGKANWSSTDYTRYRTNYLVSRQPQFYKACSKHLIQQNKSWYEIVFSLMSLFSFAERFMFVTLNPTFWTYVKYLSGLRTMIPMNSLPLLMSSIRKISP